MSKLKSGSCVITLQDKLDVPIGIVDHLVWLKKYGAPIIGGLVLQPDPRYTISMHEDTSNGSTTVTWVPLNERQ